MGLISWAVLGLLSGFLAKLVLPKETPGGYLTATIVGIMGSLVGGYLAAVLGYGGITGLDLRSLIISLLGTLATLGPYLLFRRYRLRSALTSNSNRKDRQPAAQPASHQHSNEPKSPNRIVNQQAPPAQGKVNSRECIIFVSYRRADSADITGRLYDRLVAHFGKPNVFKDVDSIPLGVDFRRHIESMVSTCTALLVVIGDLWSPINSSTMRSRLEDSNDYVRIEIEVALKRNIPVIPLLVKGASMPSEEGLPSSLKELAYRNSIEIRPDPDFHRDVDRLIDGLVRAN